MKPPACTAPHVENTFVAQVRKPTHEMTFFTSEQWIGSTVVDRSPALVALGNRDGAGITRGGKFPSASCQRLGLDLGAAVHRLSALGFRRSMNCCIHFSSRGAP